MRTPYLADERTTVYAGDCLDVLREMPDNSVDAIVTDPPYGLAALPQKKVEATLLAWLSGDREYVPAGRGFMNKAWDRFVPPPAMWAEAYRVLKPGGYLAAFAGTRTQDLMGMSIRLAGFQLKDGLQWLRADSFAKTKHSLKPGYEPILLAQKALDGTIEQTIERWGTGGLNIEASRTPFVNDADEAESKGKNQHGAYGTEHGGNSVYGDYSRDEKRGDYDAPGRWPANLMMTDEAARQLDAANPTSKSRSSTPREGAAGDGWRTTSTGAEYDDEGGPSRFFPRLNDGPSFFYAGRATVKERPVAELETKLRLRADLTMEQADYVLAELRVAGL